MAIACDAIIRGGQIVSRAGVIAADVAIRSGQVVALLSPGEPAENARVVDADGLHVLPGLIDTHVHFRDPGGPEREDFLSGSRAAAAGGVTCVLEMPISEPGVGSAAILKDRASQVGRRSVIDFGLYGGAGITNLDELEPMAAAGAIGFKTFLHPPAPGRETEFEGMWCNNTYELRQVLGAVRQTGLVHCIHCEDEPIVAGLRQEASARSHRSGLAYAEARPPIAEDVAVAYVLALAAEAGARVQVVHVSSAAAAELVREAKSRGVQVTAEAAPHHLFLTTAHLEEFGPFCKSNPPLRSPENVAALWSHVLDGTIDLIGSDHAPFTEAEKRRGEQNIFEALPGIPGLEVMLGLLLTEVANGRLTLPDIARLTAESAASIYPLARKGRIEVGKDADFALVDLSERWTFDPRRSESKAGMNMRAYEGRALQGRVQKTIVRGEIVYDRGEVLVGPGYGQFVSNEGRP